MQYVGKVGGYVYNQWNSLNPATLSGAIDIIVIEHADGSLHTSPWHVRFGKFQIIKPLQKKIDLVVNGLKTDLPMKLGDSGEAFFVFETENGEDLSQSVLTSPVISPVNSREGSPGVLGINGEDVDLLELDSSRPSTPGSPGSPNSRRIAFEKARKFTQKLNIPSNIDVNGDMVLDMDGYKSDAKRNIDNSAEYFKKLFMKELDVLKGEDVDWDALISRDSDGRVRIATADDLAVDSNATSDAHAEGVTVGDILGDYHRNEKYEEDLVSDLISTSDLTPEPADLSEQTDLTPTPQGLTYPSSSNTTVGVSDVSINGVNSSESINASSTPPDSPTLNSTKPTKTYFKTLRLTSEQLSSMNLHYGANKIQFKIAEGTSEIISNLYLWKSETPIVISDIDGTITKSDALGHVLNLIGKDWTHPGVANLFQDIKNNGYNIMYLTSRSVGQADSTRQYLDGVTQDGVRIPKGPVILSPDRTMAALKREVILKKPEVFKMACLNDIRSLYFDNLQKDDARTPFYAGFGNRITDAISYRSVKIPSHRIFTINPNGEVHMELLQLAGYRSSYMDIGELVDHFYPPIKAVLTWNSNWNNNQLNEFIHKREHEDLRLNTGAPITDMKTEEKYSDVNYWREPIQYDFDELSDDEDEPPSGSALPKSAGSRSPILGAIEDVERPISSFTSPLKNFMMFGLREALNEDDEDTDDYTDEYGATEDYDDGDYEDDEEEDDDEGEEEDDDEGEEEGDDDEDEEFEDEEEEFDAEDDLDELDLDGEKSNVDIEALVNGINKVGIDSSGLVIDPPRVPPKSDSRPNP